MDEMYDEVYTHCEKWPTYSWCKNIMSADAQPYLDLFTVVYIQTVFFFFFLNPSFATAPLDEF